MYSTVSKSPKQLLSLLKRTKASVVAIDFKFVLFNIRAILQSCLSETFALYMQGIKCNDCKIIIFLLLLSFRYNKTSNVI